MKAPCVFLIWPIWAFINSAKQASWVYANITDSYGEKNHFLPTSCISRNSNEVMYKQPIEWSVTRHSDDGWGSSLFKKLAGRGGHHRVIRCASRMAICLPHEAVSHVACRRACILIGLLLPLFSINKKIGWLISRPINRSTSRHNWSSTRPKEPMLHLSLSPCTGYQFQLASSSRHWFLHIEQPQAQHLSTSTHYYESTSPPEVWDLLVSDASWYHHREAQNHSPEHSLSPFLAGGMIFPPPSGMLDPCQSLSNN